MWMSQGEVSNRNHWGPANEPALVCAEAPFNHAFHYWRGASGHRHLHTVYNLVDCPALPRANYILVRCHDDGSREPLNFGQTKDDAHTLNLAHLRHEGAKLGANEVHIHLLADTPEERDQVEMDLTAAHAKRFASAA
jgi:hypothetical protein